MTNEKEILELSQWLFDKVFEPDWWARENELGRLHLYPKFDLNYNQPYMSLNRALELLPDSIEGFNLEFSKVREYLAYVKHISESEIHYHKSQVTWIGQRAKDISYHLAALRLLKKTVEENYVKAN